MNFHWIRSFLVYSTYILAAPHEASRSEKKQVFYLGAAACYIFVTNAFNTIFKYELPDDFYSDFKKIPKIRFSFR